MHRPEYLDRTLRGLIHSLEIALATLDECGVHSVAKHVDAALVQLLRELDDAKQVKQRAA